MISAKVTKKTGRRSPTRIPLTRDTPYGRRGDGNKEDDEFPPANVGPPQDSSHETVSKDPHGCNDHL